MMTRDSKMVAALVGLVGIAGLWACGGDDGIGGTATGQLSVGAEILEIPQMGPSSASSNFSDDNALALNNSGDERMEIESIEWVDQPSRVTGYTDEVVTSLTGDGCTEQAECPEDSVCLTTAQECRATGFADMPREVRSGQTFVQSLTVAGDTDGPVQCPTSVPDDIPEELEGRYCGAIKVETSATNNEGAISDGDITIYLSRGAGGGIKTLPENVIEFTQAAPGVPQQKDFVIENTDTVPLEIAEASFGTNASWFEVDPPLSGATVPANGSETYTVTMTPPEDLSSDDELEFNSAVTFQSSSVGPPDVLTVSVTAGFGNVPIIEVDPLQLSFAEGSTQTFEVRNYGGATLALTNLDIRPTGEVEDFYQVFHNGTNVLEDTSALPNIQRAPDPESPRVEEFTVEFDAPADADTTIGTLRVHHQDNITGSPVEIDLLGDATEVALGEISPGQVAFRSEGGGTAQEREFAVVNRGTAPMMIDDVEFEARTGSPDLDFFEATDLSGTEVGPGEIVVGTISYDGDTEVASDVYLNIVSDDHDGASSMLQMRAHAQSMSESTMELSLLPGFADTATVGEAATINVVDDSGQVSASSIEWTMMERPADSATEVEGEGMEAIVFPDEAGTYRVSATMRDGANREEQLTLSFEAQ